MVVLLEASPISTEELGRSVRVTIRILVTCLTKALLPRLLSLAGRPALGRVVVVPNFLHLRTMQATVFLGNFNATDIFLGGSVPQHNPVSAFFSPPNCVPQSRQKTHPTPEINYLLDKVSEIQVKMLNGFRERKFCGESYLMSRVFSVV